MNPHIPEHWPSVAAAAAALAGAAWAAGWVASRILHRAIRSVTSRTRSTWDDRIIERGFFRRMARVVPAVVVYAGIGPALDAGGAAPAEGTALLVATFVRRVAAAFIALAVARAVHGLLDAVNDIYGESCAEAGSRPIKGYLQVATLAAYLAAAVVMVSVLAGMSPVVFLSGLGALAAVLMLAHQALPSARHELRALPR